MDVVPGEGESVLDHAAHSEGIVVLRNLTKTFGLAGIRMGYLVLVAALVLVLALWGGSVGDHRPCGP